MTKAEPLLTTVPRGRPLIGAPGSCGLDDKCNRCLVTVVPVCAAHFWLICGDTLQIDSSRIQFAEQQSPGWENPQDKSKNSARWLPLQSFR
jgi:hypothetical protein